MRALAGEYKNVIVHVLTEGGYVDGERQPEFYTAVQDKMAPRPVTLSQEKHLPEGTYKAGDMKFYRQGALVYKSGDIIEYNNAKYRIGDISDRPEGRFVFYFTKRIYHD